MCRAGYYQYVCMSFGLKNASATIKSAFETAVSCFKWKACLGCIEDIIIYSKNVYEHIRHVELILMTLKEDGITLKMNNYKLFRDKVEYLVHLMPPGRL